MLRLSLSRMSVAAIAVVALQAQAAGLRAFPIADPVFSTTAYTIQAPADWTVVGTVLPPPSCSAATPVVIRASSADGSMGLNFLPADTWAWGGGIAVRADCDAFQRPVSAQDYLTYFVRATKVGFVSDFPVPESRRFSAEHPGETVDQAAYRVRYSVGSKQMEAILLNTVVCFDFSSMGPGGQHQCSAIIQRWYTPYGKMNAMIPTFTAMTTRVNPAWMSAWTNAMQNRVNSLSQQQTQTMLRQGAIAGQARMGEHNAFMASQQAGADRRDIQFQAGQYRKQNNNDNLVDFILGCSRAYGDDGRVSVGNCPDRQTY